MNRRKFLFGALLTAPASAAAAVGGFAAQHKPEISAAGHATENGAWPMQVLEIEGRDGKKHRIPAWE